MCIHKTPAPHRRLAFALFTLVVGAAGCSSDNAGGPALVIPDLRYGLDAHFPRSPLELPNPAWVVTNSGDDTLSLLELEPDGGLVERLRFPVGLNPVEPEGLHHAAIDSMGGFLYVGLSYFVPGGGSGPHGAHGTGTVDGSILKLRASDLALVGQVRVDHNPGDLILSGDGRTLFVSHYDVVRLQDGLRLGRPADALDSRLLVIDAASMTRRSAIALCPAAHGMRVSQNGTTLYASCATDELAVVDLSAPNFSVRRVPVGATPSPPSAPVCQPYAVAVVPNGHVWVSCLGSRELRIYDPVMDRFVTSRTVALPGPPLFGEVSSDGGTFFVPVQGVDALVGVRIADGAITSQQDLRVAGCQNPHQVLLVPASPNAMDASALIVCEGDHLAPGSVVRVPLPGATAHPIASVPVGVFPDSVGKVMRPGQ